MQENHVKHSWKIKTYPPQRKAVWIIKQWRICQIGLVHVHRLWPPKHEITRVLPFRLLGHFKRSSYNVPPLSCFPCCPPWRQRVQNKTSKQLQNSPDTNSFPHVTWRGKAGSLDCSDSGMFQPPTLRYLITSGGDGMPFWQSDYGQSDIDLKGARWGENLQGPICGSCWAQMRWGNGSSFSGMLLAVKDHKWLQLVTILRWSSRGWDSLYIQLLKLSPDILWTTNQDFFKSDVCTKNTS